MSKQRPLSSFSSLLFLLLLLLLVILPPLVKADCTCDSDENGQRDKSTATKYKFIAFAVILIAGAVGASTPILGKKIPPLSPGNDFFYVMKSFAGGVILATGAVHIAPDAFANLTSPCLKNNPWGDYPFTGLIIGVSMMGTMMIDVVANSYFSRAEGAVMEEDMEANGNKNDHGGHTHVHGSSKGSHSSKDLIRERVVAQVLELGILVHSVIIGIDMGVSQSPDTIKPLVIAITFHQMFEGMGLGGCISQANFKVGQVTVMILFFALTTPVGILIGFGISNVYSDTSPTALIVEGTMNAAAAGILFYMALVDVLAADFMSFKLQNNMRLLLGVGVSMVLGFSCMSLLAIWA